jgi:hypothetical protein
MATGSNPLIAGGVQTFAPNTTATAATVITALVPPRGGMGGSGPNQSYFTRLLSLEYLNNAAATQTITILRSMNKTGSLTCPLGAAVSQSVITINKDPGAAAQMLGPNGQPSQLASDILAAGDWLAWENSDGTYGWGTVASVALPAITMNTSVGSVGSGGLASAISAGAVVWWFGQVGDVNPLDPMAGAHPAFLLDVTGTLGVVKTLGNAAADALGGGMCCSLTPYAPMIISSNNQTTAGFLRRFTVAYSLLA